MGWLGRKDSNLRMLESKSSALTNLATPQHRLPPWGRKSKGRAFSGFSPPLSNNRERMPVQSGGNEAFHIGGQRGQGGLRGGLPGKLDEATGARSAHARVAVVPQPGEMAR